MPCFICSSSYAACYWSVWVCVCVWDLSQASCTALEHLRFSATKDPLPWRNGPGSFHSAAPWAGYCLRFNMAALPNWVCALIGMGPNPVGAGATVKLSYPSTLLYGGHQTCSLAFIFSNTVQLSITSHKDIFFKAALKCGRLFLKWHVFSQE